MEPLRTMIFANDLSRNNKRSRNQPIHQQARQQGSKQASKQTGLMHDCSRAEGDHVHRCCASSTGSHFKGRVPEAGFLSITFQPAGLGQNCALHKTTAAFTQGRGGQGLCLYEEYDLICIYKAPYKTYSQWKSAPITKDASNSATSSSYR